MSKHEELLAYLASKGILDQASTDAEIAKMAAKVPAATVAEKGLTTDIDKAYEVMMIENGMGGSASPAVTQSAKGAVAPTATSADQAALKSRAVDAAQDRRAVSLNSRLTQYHISRPDPAKQIPAGSKGVIDKESWAKIQAKIDSGEYVIPDEVVKKKDKQTITIPNRKNYEALKAAAENGTPIEVHIGAMSKRPIGYDAQIAAGSGSKNERFTRQTMQSFLTFVAYGCIQPEGDAGVRLRQVGASAKADQLNNTVKKMTVIDTNKNVLFDKGAYVPVRELSDTQKEQTVKSELSFYVEVTSKVNAENKHPQRAIRASIKMNLPVLEMKAEFKDLYGSRATDTSTVPTTAEQIAEMAKVIAMAQEAVLTDSSQMDILRQDPTYKTEIEALQGIIAGNNAAPAGV